MKFIEIFRKKRKFNKEGNLMLLPSTESLYWQRKLGRTYYYAYVALIYKVFTCEYVSIYCRMIEYS